MTEQTHTVADDFTSKLPGVVERVYWTVPQSYSNGPEFVSHADAVAYAKAQIGGSYYKGEHKPHPLEPSDNLERRIVPIGDGYVHLYRAWIAQRISITWADGSGIDREWERNEIFLNAEERATVVQKTLETPRGQYAPKASVAS